MYFLLLLNGLRMKHAPPTIRGDEDGIQSVKDNTKKPEVDIEITGCERVSNAI